MTDIADTKLFSQRVTIASGYEVLAVDDPLQTLWGGYGYIRRVHLNNDSVKSVIVKDISIPVSDSGKGPQKNSAHPRGWNTLSSYQRKVTSYAVEQNWYTKYSTTPNPSFRTARLFGAVADDKGRLLVLEDLDKGFPTRRDQLNYDQTLPCLQWLANFHAYYLAVSPKDLWTVGCYWHLGTRKDEYEAMAYGGLRTAASALDSALLDCPYQTIVHGDAKVANFCFSESGASVAAVDFQYVGAGPGIRDLMYFLGSCLSSEQRMRHETGLVDYYFLELERALSAHRGSMVQRKWTASEIQLIVSSWRQLTSIAEADFQRFLSGWLGDSYHEHNKYNEYALALTEDGLRKLVT